MKIHIIGGSGSGKSYLAEFLSRKYRLPHCDLDDLFWDRSADICGVKASSAERTRRLNLVLAQDGWIVEGVYYDWLDASFAGADRIILLEMPLALCRARILRRFSRRKLHPETGRKETLRSLFALLKWTEKYQRKNLPAIRQKLAAYPGKVTVIRGKKELNRWLWEHDQRTD